MPSENVQFIQSTKASISSAPVSNGSTIWTTDSQELFVDTNGQRIQITDIIVLRTEVERRSLLAPKSKFYYCKDSGNLWYKNGVWKLVGQQGSIRCAMKELVYTDSPVTEDKIAPIETGWLVRRISISSFSTGEMNPEGTGTFTLKCKGSESEPSEETVATFDISVKGSTYDHENQIEWSGNWVAGFSGDLSIEVSTTVPSKTRVVIEYVII